MGASFRLLTVRVKVCAALVSTPLLAVPPSSCAMTVTVAEPKALAAGVKVSVPPVLTTGWLLKSALLSFVTVKLTTCDDSFAGPAEMLVTAKARVFAPESSHATTPPATPGEPSRAMVG